MVSKHELQAQKQANIKKQEIANAQGELRHQARVDEDTGKLKESVARQIFSGGLNFKQALDLPRKTFSGGRPYRHGIDPPIMEGQMRRRFRLQMEAEEKRKKGK